MNAIVTTNHVERNPVHIQVRVSSNLESSSSHIKAMMDLTWGESMICLTQFILDYPYEKPSIQIISIDLDSNSKEQFAEQLLSSCDDFIGMAMTFVLSSALVELLNTFHEMKLSKMKAITEVLIFRHS